MGSLAPRGLILGAPEGSALSPQEPPCYQAAMYLGTVLGTVVATQSVETLRGHRLLLVQPLDEHQTPRGSKQVAVDTVSAGPGDLVFLVGSREAALAIEPSFVPIDAAVVGIVDDVHVPEHEDPPKKKRAAKTSSKTSKSKKR